MWRTLKAAFLARPRVPGLGDVPVNLVGLACFGILGFVNPGFWFLGLGAEALYLTTLATNRRFQKYAVAQDLDDAGADPEAGARILEIAGRLPAGARERLGRLDATCARILTIHRERGYEDYLTAGNRQSLDRLRLLFAQLLAARHDLETADPRQLHSSLRAQIAELERELAGERASSSVRTSKSATVEVLKRRLQSLERRGETLEEIDSDLTRIEAQVDLALESILIEGKPHVISSRVDLVSHLLDGSPMFDEPVLETPLQEPPLHEPPAPSAGEASGRRRRAEKEGP